MGRVVTRSSGKFPRAKNSPDESTSSQHLRVAESGRVGKRKRRSMASKKSVAPNVDECVLSLSLEDAHETSEISQSSLDTTSDNSQSSLDTTHTSSPVSDPDASQSSFPEHVSDPDASQSSFPEHVPNPDTPQEPTVTNNTHVQNPSSSIDERRGKECSICLNKPLQPVKLPCSHIFCYLCIKGVVQSSVGTCALCRAHIPRNFIFSPEVVEESSQSEEEEEEEELHTWFYEGRSGGWWEFDARTAEDIETKYNEDTEEPKVLELLIAGLIFVIDLDAMVQKRKNAPNIQRRLKRDVKHISDKKGVAGIFNKTNTRRPQRNNDSHDRRQGTPV